MGNNTRYLLLGGVALVLIALVGYFLFSGGKKNRPSGGKGNNPMSQTTDPTVSGGGGNVSEGNGVNPEGLNDGVTPEFLIKEFQEWAQYPPFSRPITDDNRDLVFPFKVDIDAITMLDTPNDKEPNGYRCHFQPKTWAVIGPNADMHVTLECRDNTGHAIPIKILNQTMYKYKEWDGTQTSTHSADYNDDGRDGDETAKDNIYTFTWRPLKADWSQMILEANIAYGKDKKAKLTATFFSSPNKPAEFTGVFRESITDGSLVIHSSMIVYKAGNYHLEANLKEAQEGKYLAYASFDGPLKAGTQEVDFIYFGKILRDKAYDGPYVLTNARGHRVNLAIDPAWLDQGDEGLKKIQAAKTTEPDREIVIPFTDEYKTKPYQVSQFSNKVWNSDDKTKRLQELQALKK